MSDDILPIGLKLETSGIEKGAASLDTLASKGPKVDAALKKVEDGAKGASKSLESLGGAATAAATPLERAATSLAGLATAYASIKVSSSIITGFYDLTKAVASVQVELDKFRLAFELSGTSISAAREFEFIRDAARDLSVNLAAAGDGYRRFALAARDTAIEGDKAKAVFLAVSKASSVMGLSASESQGVFLALGQMISKGVVQSEELRGQLGERLPGAFQIAARAMGVTTAELGKMLETGQVLSEDFLPKFAAQLEKEFGKKAADAANTAQGAINRLENSWLQLKQTFADSGAGTAAAGQLNILADGITGIEQAMLASKAAGDGWFSQMVSGFGSLLGFLNPLNGLSYSVRDLNKQMEEGNAILANPKSGMYQRSSAAADVENAAQRLGQINSAKPYSDAFERGATAEFAKNAKDTADAAAKAEAAVNAFASAKANLSVHDQKVAAQTKLLNDFAKSVRGVANDTALYAKAQAALNVGLAGVDKDFAKKLNPGSGEAASKAKSDAEAYATAIAAGEKRNKLLAAEVEARRPLTEQEKVSIELAEKQEELSRKHGSSRLAEIKAIDATTQALLAQIAARKGEAESLASSFGAAIAISDARESSVDALIKEAEGAEAQVKALQQETAALGLTGEALVKVTNARTDDIIESLKISKLREDITSRELTAIDRQIAALERLKAERFANNAKQETVDFEKRDTASILANAKKAEEEQARAAQNVADEWKRAYDQIGQGLTDSLFRAAESGKSFFLTLRDSIKGMFNNLVLKPLIQAGVSSVASAVGLGGDSAGGAALGGLSSLGSLGNTASSLSKLYGSLFGGASLASVGGGITATGGLTAGSLGATQLGLGVANGGAILGGGTALTGAGAVTGAATTATLGSTISTALAAIPVWGWALMAAAAIAAVVGQERGGPKSGGSYSTTGERLFTPATADPMVAKIGETIGTSINATVQRFGASAQNTQQLQFGIGFDQDPLGKADSRISSFLRDAKGNSVLDNVSGRDVGRDDATLKTELGTEAKRLLLAALQASDLQNGFVDIFKRLDPAAAAPEAIDSLLTLAEQLKGLGDAAKDLPGVMSSVAELTAVAREELIGYAGGLDQLTAQQGAYYTKFFSEQEQLDNSGRVLTDRFGKIGLSFEALKTDADGPRQAFRDLVEGLDLTTTAGKQSYAALLALADPFDQYIGAIDEAAAANKQFADSIDKAFLSNAEYLAKQFKDMGLTLPANAAGFEALVRGMDGTTDKGKELVSRVLGLKGAFDQAADAADAISGSIDKAFLTDAQFLNKTFQDLGLALPGTIEGFEALVRGIDTSTEEGAQLATTVLGLKGSFEATLPVVDLATAALERLNEASGSISSEMAAIANALNLISPPVETASEQLIRMAGELNALETAMDGILGNGGQSNLERLQSLISTRDGVHAARTGVASAIDEQRLTGFQARGDTAGAVAFLKSIETKLWTDLSTATDKGAVANQIKDTFLRRMGVQTSAAQAIVDAANQKAFDDAKDLQDLDKEHRADQIDALKELISNTEKFKQLAQSLREAIADIKISDLSPLNPQEKLDEAINNFDAIIKKAFGGDADAIGKSAGAAQALLQQNNSFNASTPARSELFNEVVARLDALQTGLDNGSIQAAPKPELTAQEKQLQALLNIKDPILELQKTTVDFSTDAVAGLLAIDEQLGVVESKLNVEVTKAIEAVVTQMVGLRTDIRTNAENQGLRWVSLGGDLDKINNEVVAIKNNTATSATAAQAANAAPEVAA